MKTSFFLKLEYLIPLLILTSLISAYTIGLNPIITAIIIIIPFITVYKREAVDSKSIVLLIICSLLMIYLILPDLVYPSVHSDFYNHASNAKVLSRQARFSSGELVYAYPRGTSAALAALIQLLPFNFFQTTSLFSIIIYLLTIISVNKLSNKLLKDSNQALLATIIFTFSITTIWNLQLGFIPSVIGFYLFINCLLYEDNNRLLSVLNGGVLAAVYPHYFIVLSVYYLLKGLVKQELISSIKRVVLFMFVGGFELVLSSLGVLFYKLDSALLIKGGIFAPNIIFITLTFVLLFFAVKGFKRKDFARVEVLFFLSILALQMILSFSVLVNWLFNITGVVTLKQFYMVVKLFYLQLIPLSISACRRINLDMKLIIIIGAVFLLFFTGYLFYVKSNTYISPEVFIIGVAVQELIPENNTISLDPLILNSVIINEPPFYYDSLIRLSSDYSDIIKVNAEKSLRADWMKFSGDGFYYDNITVFNYGLSGDYYIGFNGSVSGQTLFRTNSLFLKKLS